MDELIQSVALPKGFTIPMVFLYVADLESLHLHDDSGVRWHGIKLAFEASLRFVP